MRTGLLYIFAGIAMSLGQISSANEAESTKPAIVDATWSLYTWKVLGWQYDAPLWRKGSEEKGSVGEKGQIDRDKNVRAVCLGTEGEWYVFFTLRSFVDAAFPNLFVQGVKGPPLDAQGAAFSESSVESEAFVRYGEILLVHYEDAGGGTLKITQKIQGATHCDPNNPKAYGIKRWEWYRRVLEDINGVQYENPHREIPAHEHLRLQKELKITVKYLTEHDVALIYIPKDAVTGEVNTVGINNPTFSVRMMFEHGKDLFGFKFVLLGKETVKLIKDYNPDGVDERLKGFQKLFMVAGVVFDYDVLGSLKWVDGALDGAISDKLKDVKSRKEAGKVFWDEYSPIMKQILNDEDVIKQLRLRIFKSMFPTIPYERK